MWPTPQDFEEEIQNPYISFKDPELRGGSPELTSLGFPKPRSGNFATVYQIQSIEKKWAVKCFSREMADKSYRYAAISEYLRKTSLPYFIDFEFQQEGIQVGSEWYPILKMEWIEGECLDKYINRNIHEPRKLTELAQQFVTMMADLHRWKISHGDLHHHNILIANDKIKLIDYDGMFVPFLSGNVSQEIGHTHYQHPLRTPFDFGPFLDHFPAWNIFITLQALSISPSLWFENNDKDEYLLFCQEDFLNPESSEVVHKLERIEQMGVNLYLSQWRSFCYEEVTQIPALLEGNKTDEAPSFCQQEAAAMLETANSIFQEPSIRNPTWIFDHLQPTAMKTAKFTLWPERIFLLSGILVNPWRPLLSFSEFVQRPLLVILALLFTVRYFTHPFIREKWHTIFSLILLHFKKILARHRITMIQRKKVEQFQAWESIREDQLQRFKITAYEKDQAIHQLKQGLLTGLSPLSLKRQKINLTHSGEAKGQQLLQQQIRLKQKNDDLILGVVKEYKARIHFITDQFNQIQQQLDVEREMITQELEKESQHLSGLNWKIEITKHQLQQCKHVHLLFYFKQILFSSHFVKTGQKKSLH